MYNILICGTGGQGIVLTSRLLAKACAERGEAVRTAETIGMAQRGGCVASHVRIGECASPLVPAGEADLIIAFEPSEAVRSLKYLKPDGKILVCTTPIVPVTAAKDGNYDGKAALEYLKTLESEVFIFDGDAFEASCGGAKALNVGILSAAVALGLCPMSEEELEAALNRPPLNRRVEQNRKAVEEGKKLAERKQD